MGTETLGRRLLRTLVTGGLVLATIIPAMPAASQVDDQYADARKRLLDLKERITNTEASVEQLQSRLEALSSRVGREQTDLEATRVGLAATERQIAESRARASALKDQIHSRARDVYMRGPSSVLGVILGAESFGDFVERMSYASRLNRHDTDLVLGARGEQAKLNDALAQHRRLEREQAANIGTLRAQQDALTNVFADQQGRLAELARDRAQLQKLVDNLADQLASGELAAVRRVAGRGMTISYGAWAEAFLTALGVPTARSNLVAVVSWEAAEGTQATWNPLATTYYMPESTVYNSHNVRNFASMGDGIQASIRTLEAGGHGYEAILDSLERAADSMETGRAINKSDWCRGCAGGAYVVGLIPAVERYYDRYAGD